MALTRDFSLTVIESIKRDPAVGRGLLDEAMTMFLNGEPDIARLVLRDLVNATIGFPRLAKLTHKPVKSLHRMLSLRGNPTMDNLAAIIDAVRAKLHAEIKVTVRAA